MCVYPNLPKMGLSVSTQEQSFKSEQHMRFERYVCACKNGDLAVVVKLLGEYMTGVFVGLNLIQVGFDVACKNGKIQVVKHIIETFKNINKTKVLNMYIEYVCEDSTFVLLTTKKFKSYFFTSFKECCKNGNIEVIEYLFDEIYKHPAYILNTARFSQILDALKCEMLWLAASEKQDLVCEYLIDDFRAKHKLLGEAFILATQNENISVMKYIIKQAETHKVLKTVVSFNKYSAYRRSLGLINKKFSKYIYQLIKQHKSDDLEYVKTIKELNKNMMV